MKRLQIYYGSVEVINTKSNITEVLDGCIYKENATPKDRRVIEPTLSKMGVSHKNFNKYKIKRFLYETAKKIGKTVYYV